MVREDSLHRSSLKALLSKELLCHNKGLQPLQ